MSTPSETMARVRLLYDESGLTLDELGQRMDASTKTPRQTAWQFLNKTSDPRLSMLLKFCKATGIEVTELFAEAKTNPTKKSPR